MQLHCYIDTVSELRNLEGRFNISDTFVDEYLDENSVTYTALRNQVVAGVSVHQDTNYIVVVLVKHALSSSMRCRQADT